MFSSIFYRPSELNSYAYVYANPINSKDTFGLRRCNTCDDCPEGEWKGSSSFGLQVFGGGGFFLERTFWYCKSSNVTCDVSIFCFGGGAIAEIGVDIVQTCTATGACKRNDLGGMSSGLRVSVPVAPWVGVSGTKTWSDGTSIECLSAGIGFGGGAAFITCVTIAITCSG